MKRQYSPTSKAAEQFIKPHKTNHYDKILEGLEKLKVGGTYEEIAVVSGLKEQQVWKRLSEMERNGQIFNTGMTRRLSSGMNGGVWQVSGKIIQMPPTPGKQLDLL